MASMDVKACFYTYVTRSRFKMFSAGYFLPGVHPSLGFEGHECCIRVLWVCIVPSGASLAPVGAIASCPVSCVELGPWVGFSLYCALLGRRRLFGHV